MEFEKKVELEPAMKTQTDVALVEIEVLPVAAEVVSELAPVLAGPVPTAEKTPTAPNSEALAAFIDDLTEYSDNNATDRGAADLLKQVNGKLDELHAITHTWLHEEANAEAALDDQAGFLPDFIPDALRAKPMAEAPDLMDMYLVSAARRPSELDEVIFSGGGGGGGDGQPAAPSRPGKPRKPRAPRASGDKARTRSKVAATPPTEPNPNPSPSPPARARARKRRGEP